MNEKDKNKDRLLIILIVILLIVLCLLGFKMCSSSKSTNGGETTPNVPVEMDESQGEYKVPEMANFISKNITLPGWGSFTIPSDTTYINKGFEFHNPESNLWNEVDISHGNSILENMIIDSESMTAVEHYCKLAGIEGETYKLTAYDSNNFELITQDGVDYIRPINVFDGESNFTVTVDGKEHQFSAACRQNVYYMTFALYLSEGDELLYQSGLVSPGNYIQTMEISRPLSAGSYDAYVFIQPYKSDRATKTNSGRVVITLNVG